MKGVAAHVAIDQQDTRAPMMTQGDCQVCRDEAFAFLRLGTADENDPFSG